MKQILTLLVLSGTLIFVSCGNSENEQLKKRIAELEAQLQSNQAQAAAVQAMDLAPIDNATLAEFLGAFNASGTHNVRVPISWQMEKSALQTILGKVDSEGHEAIGLMVYPMKDKDYMKLALIPYYKDGGNYKHFKLEELGAYDYSNMCPPGQNCATSDGNFGAATDESVWAKQ